ncbi:MAG: CBS domain-containing protein [Pseudomonadota bacterium]
MNVRQIISRKPVQSVATISAGATLTDAAGALAAKKIGALVVSESGLNVEGIISERDIVRRLAQDGASCVNLRVADAMITKVIACEPQDTVESVLQRMTEGRFRHMPVVDNGSLLGVISIGDAVKARMDEIEQENRAMEEMIKGV